MADEILNKSWEQVRPRFHSAIVDFVASPPNASLLYRLEVALMATLLALGRAILQAVLNGLEPMLTVGMPHNVMFQG